MDSYIVRVYRRGVDETGKEIAGLVEEVGSEHRMMFQSLSGLLTTIQEIVGPNKREMSDIHELSSGE